MVWKYVMFSALVPCANAAGTTIVELPVIFPLEITHKQIADGVQRGIGMDRHSRGVEVKPTSAGFVEHLHGPEARCYGSSESLGLTAHVKDTDILREVARRNPFFYP